MASFYLERKPEEEVDAEECDVKIEDHITPSDQRPNEEGSG